MSESFFWHDYETWGANPFRDRAAQFAGLRTDLEFNVIGEPLVQYCRPADDFLPSPEACLVTGITLVKRGLTPFIAMIYSTTPSTTDLNINSHKMLLEATKTRYIHI